MSRLTAQAQREAAERATTEALIVEAYADNQSLRDIANATKLSHEHVRQVLIRHKVEIRGRGRAAQPKPAE